MFSTKKYKNCYFTFTAHLRSLPLNLTLGYSLTTTLRDKGKEKRIPGTGKVFSDISVLLFLLPSLFSTTILLNIP